MTRERWGWVLWVAATVWVTGLLVALHAGLLRPFFFDAAHGRENPGIDFFQIGRAFENFLDGRSLFDTFGGRPYGPYATWYVYHPALALLLGPWLAPFAPWTAYRVWTVVSVALMGGAAWLIAGRGGDPVRRPIVFLLLLGSFPLLVMLRAGNVQAIPVLALTLVLVAVDAMRETGANARNRRMLLGGLLLSLFSKPTVFLMLPLLVCLRETRGTALKALGIYAAVSVGFLVVPGLNPEAMSWAQRWDLAMHPAVVRQTMDVYSNGFTVTEAMKDNSIHWLEMVAMTDTRLQNVDVYSLPVFVDGWLGGVRTPEVWYRVPGILVLGMSVLVLTLREREARLEAALLVLMAASLLFFLSFGIVWEYSYTAVFPVAGILLMRPRMTRATWAICGATALVWGPSLFFVTSEEGRSIFSLMTWMRAGRVLPVVVIFCVLLGTAGMAVYRQGEPRLRAGRERRESRRGVVRAS